MARTVLVSNRVALPGRQRPGGLAVALRAAVREDAGLWFGWSGRIGNATQLPQRCRDGGVDYLTVGLNEDEAAAYYRDYSNRVLWPLLHSRVDLIDYQQPCSEGYRRVNARFARVLARELRGDDLIWVHDYHLVPLAHELRNLGVSNRIGFFLHVPFPPADLAAVLPRHRELFGCLADYDLVGVQTQADATHLREYLDTHAPVAGPGGAIRRSPRVDAYPVGIDAEAIAAQAALAESTDDVRRLRASLGGRGLAIGVDRLDYSKGLPERLRAFGQHLARHPDLCGQLTYLQIATPSRSEVAEYRHLRAELDALAGHINGAHARPDWTPIRYVNHDYPHRVLTGFYRAARIGLVTPLRDGMNLVAKEYAASQSADDPGVLVLSRFAGAAQQMQAAVLVNPHDGDEVADAIATAARMPLAQRRERWHALWDGLRRDDIVQWRRRYLQDLAECGPRGRALPAPALPSTPRHGTALAALSPASKTTL
ncbi:alpha,alpha-trehalose-phosphate synthase (UDP-forming) [Lysobacter silvisoli]|uniref:Trehalose-6-phosphate synthase n=1 Tax=Lysobacter silvisoli TaxID=2293254 RepID=A0A371K3S1_9GAMM|nr:trehalose-6-phosphate synthase [Lysobacter silvisoli]